MSKTLILIISILSVIFSSPSNYSLLYWRNHMPWSYSLMFVPRRLIVLAYSFGSLIQSQINVFVWCKVDITGYRYAVVQVSFVEDHSFPFLIKSFSYLCLKSINWKWNSLSRVQLFATPWTIQSMEFSRPEYWSGKPFPSPGDLPNAGIKPGSPTLQADRSFTSWATREAQLKIN